MSRKRWFCLAFLESVFFLKYSSLSIKNKNCSTIQASAPAAAAASDWQKVQDVQSIQSQKQKTEIKVSSSSNSKFLSPILLGENPRLKLKHPSTAKPHYRHVKQRRKLEIRTCYCDPSNSSWKRLSARTEQKVTRQKHIFSREWKPLLLWKWNRCIMKQIMVFRTASSVWC